MYPILWHSGDIVLASWHVFFALACIMAYFAAQRLKSDIDRTIQSNTMDAIFTIAYILGYLGARGLSVLVEKEYRNPDFSLFSSLFSHGSMTLLGGVVAAVIGILAYGKFRKIALTYLADLCVPATLLGIAIGRIGCFLNGDDYGVAFGNQSQVPFFAVVFPNLGDETFRHPVQLYEAVICFIGFLLLSWGIRHQPANKVGLAGSIGIYLYLISRFFLEYVRGDADRGSVLSGLLSTSQAICVILLVCWTGALLLRSKKTALYARPNQHKATV